MNVMFETVVKADGVGQRGRPSPIIYFTSLNVSTPVIETSVVAMAIQ